MKSGDDFLHQRGTAQPQLGNPVTAQLPYHGLQDRPPGQARRGRAVQLEAAHQSGPQGRVPAKEIASSGGSMNASLTQAAQLGNERIRSCSRTPLHRQDRQVEGDTHQDGGMLSVQSFREHDGRRGRSKTKATAPVRGTCCHTQKPILARRGKIGVGQVPINARAFPSR